MACADCPPPAARRSPRLEAREAAALAAQAAQAFGLSPAPGPSEPPVETLAVMRTGEMLLPQGEPTILIKVSATRLHQGLPPILLRHGVKHEEIHAVGGVKILGPSTLAHDGGGIGLFTSAAVEVIA